MANKIKFPKEKSNRIILQAQLQKYNLNFATTMERVNKAVEHTEDLIHIGYNEIDKFYRDNRTDLVEQFNNTRIFRTWFGEATKKSHVKDVRNRLKGLSKRSLKGLVIRVRPNKKGSGTRGKSIGVLNFDTGNFTIYSAIFKEHNWEMANIFVHELAHHWFLDQKIGVKTVYGEQRAKDLALYDPNKARKSPENYSIFCDHLYQWKGLKPKVVGNTRDLDYS